MIKVLLTTKQMKHLESDGEDCFKFVDNGHVTEREKKELLELDADYYEVYQYHIITNIEELKK